MEFRQYAVLVWHWLWLILLGMLLAAGVAFVISKNTTPIYSATTRLLISPSKAQVMDTLSFQPEVERLAATYAEMMRGRPVVEEVVRSLSLPDDTRWNIDVTPIRNTQLLDLTVEDTDPLRAALVANEIPRVFVRQNSDLQARRYADSKASLQRQIGETEADIARLEDRIAAGEALDRDRRELQTLQDGYIALTASYDEVRLEEAKQLETLLVAEQAVPPAEPIRPQGVKNVITAALIGAMLALGAAFLIEYSDDLLKDPERVEEALGLPTLAAVPVTSRQASGVPAMASGPSAASEAYRVLRTNLRFAAVDRPVRTLLVTSALPREGKSVTAANLAAALAQDGQRVVLVDCDLHRPGQHKLLKLPNNAGLTGSLLSGPADPARWLQDGPVPGLRVLTSGPLPPNPAELLGSAAMREVLAALSEQVDILVLDSPPVLAVADAAILASQADRVLMVVDARLTRRKLAQQALEGLERVDAPVLGAVLNRVPASGASYPYYHYYARAVPSDSERTGQRGRWRKERAPRSIGQQGVVATASSQGSE